jgi:hypothetical protein
MENLSSLFIYNIGYVTLEPVTLCKDICLYFNFHLYNIKENILFVLLLAKRRRIIMFSVLQSSTSA